MIENFQIEDMIEQTPKFVVYKALNKKSGRKCYLKRYLVDDSSGLGKIENWQEKFASIIDEFSRINVPNLRSIISGGLDPQDGNPYVVFEWLEVSSVAELIEGKPSLGLRFTREMTEAALKALAFMHEKGLSHGALTQEEILFTDSDEKNRWVINWDPILSLRCQYGVNRFEMDEFTAPELISGSQATLQSDFFALGKTAQKAAGVKASQDGFSKWSAMMTAVSPDQRFRDVDQSLLALPKYVAASQTAPNQVVANSGTRLLVGGPAPESSNTTLKTTTDAALAQQKNSAKTAPVKKKSNGVLAGLATVVLAFALLTGAYFFLKNQEEKKHVKASSVEIIQKDESEEVPVVQGAAAEELPAGSAQKSDEAGSIVGLDDLDNLPTEFTDSLATEEALVIEEDSPEQSEMIQSSEVSEATEKLDTAEVETPSRDPVAVIKVQDRAKAKTHLKQIVQMQAVPKDIRLSGNSEQYVLFYTKSKRSRVKLVNVLGNIERVFEGATLQQVRTSYLGKQIIVTGRVVQIKGNVFIQLRDKDSIRLVNKKP